MVGTILLDIQDLHVRVDDKPILKGLNLRVESGVVHALMGPNGSGKSTLANTLLGHPKYVITQGKILFKGTDITNMDVHERARLGLFLSFQYPAEISGLTISHFLRTAVNTVRDKKLSVLEFSQELSKKMALLKMDTGFKERYLNEGFSGGEKKRCEILQMLMLQPTLAILDETDSGLDIDALRAVSEGVNVFLSQQTSVLIITHYKRILEHVRPQRLSILIDGKIALEGDGSLVDQLEAKGYGWILDKSQ